MGNKKKQKKKEEPKEKSAKIPKLEDQSLDDFLENWNESSGDENEEGESCDKAISVEKNKESKKKKKKKEGADKKQKETGEKESGARVQKSYINSLQDKDPEFYEFLKENDEELLNFDESSDEDDADEEEEGPVHQLPEKLEVASDESDFEDDTADKPAERKDEDKKRRKLGQGDLEKWTEELEKQPNLGTIGEMMEAFRAAVASIGAGDEEAKDSVKYTVEGGAVFNGVVRMCVVNLQPALKKVLKIAGDEGHYKPEKTKKWNKVQRHVKVYIQELVKLMSRVSDPAATTVLLKHVHQMMPFIQAFPKGSKLILSRLISTWCQGEETVRILAFMCVVRLVRNNPLFETAVKKMYLAYVKNCKFTSPSSLPLISFMRRSLVELLALDHTTAYYHAFVYIRQLAIHLRNAITANNKENVQAVYNWQFIHSLELWGALLGHTSSSSALQPLIYPLVQVILGTIRLVPTPKNFPLRFHCCSILTGISRSTGTFIPVLPFYLDVLNTFNFNKKSGKVSMKPIDFSCILKLSKSQLVETGFKDATIGAVYDGMLGYLADNSNKIGFPELVTPAVFQMKEFNKKCKVANYTKKVKQILDKIAANQKVVENRRKNVKFSVGDKSSIAAWEASFERDGTPLLAFYNSWRKTKDLQHLKKVSQQEKMDDYSHIPDFKKNNKKIRMKKDVLGDGDEIFGGDDSGDDSFDEEEQFKLKEDRGKKRKKSVSDDDDSDDEIEDEGDGAEKESDDEKEESVAAPAPDDSDDGGDSDVVEDLKLDDLDSEDDLADEFGVDAIIDDDSKAEESDENLLGSSSDDGDDDDASDDDSDEDGASEDD